MEQGIETSIQCTTVVNLLTVELLRRNILTVEDKTKTYNKIHQAAEQILSYKEVSKDPALCIDTINKFIEDTLKHCPDYFINP